MNAPLDTSLFEQALLFAAKAHSGTERRGKGLPYIIHPLEAATIVATITNDPEMLAAALLHDTVEDTDVTFEDIRSRFGERVAHLVQCDTSSKQLDWRTKRTSQVARLAAADLDAKIVAMGDKLSNLRAIAADYALLGDSLWSRFHAPQGKTDIVWYYHALAEALSDLKDTAAYQEFTSLLEVISK